MSQLSKSSNFYQTETETHRQIPQLRWPQRGPSNNTPPVVCHQTTVHSNFLPHWAGGHYHVGLTVAGGGRMGGITIM